MVLVGFGAAGNAGNASPPTPPFLPAAGALDAGRETGGVEVGVDEEAAVHGCVVTLPGPVRFGRTVAEDGRLGKAPPALLELPDEADPQVPVRETCEREDCAVEDLSFKTLDVLFGVLVPPVDVE